MRKPWWVRAVGLLGWVCAVLWVAAIQLKPTPQGAFGQLVLIGVLPYLVFWLWVLWGVMSFVLYVVGRAARQRAAILRDALAANRLQVSPAAALVPRGSGTLDQISLNSNASMSRVGVARSQRKARPCSFFFPSAAKADKYYPAPPCRT